MAKKETPAQEQYWRDVEALAAYEPRKQAIQWLLDGKPEAYALWALTEGYVAAFGEPRAQNRATDHSAFLFKEIPLDDALLDRHENAFERSESGKFLLSDVAQKQAFSAHKVSHSKIKHLYASPLEILVEAGSVEALDAALAYWASPSERFARGYSTQKGGWLSCHTKTQDWKSISRAMSHQIYGVMALALLLGRYEHAEAMVRRGYCPDDVFAWDSFSSWLKGFKNQPEGVMSAILGIEPRIDEACDWVWKKESALQDLENLMDGDDWTPEARSKAIELLDQGICPGYFPLARATELGDANLVSKMFAQGADPNCRYKTGVPALARMDAKKLTPELLQIWLDAGARPSMGPFEDYPFGDGMCPSALYQWTWAGETDLVKQACLKAAGPVALRISNEDGHWSTLLALAMEQGHRDLVQWMIEEMGCSLEDCDDQSGNPCSSFGDGHMKELALAYQERRELSGIGWSRVGGGGSRGGPL